GLKEWSSIKRRNKDHDRKVIQDSFIEIDLRLDKGNGLPGDMTKRANLFRNLKDIDHKDSIDLAQKVKIKWAVEGDENSKFFHGIVNKKRRHLAIKGILVDGEWIEIPNRVKSEFYSYYSNLFSALAWERSLFDVNFSRRLNSDQVFDLEDMVSNEEIKRAVWDCGSDNLVIGDIVSQEQLAFIKGRQILDDPLIINEVISWWDHLDDILGKFGFRIKWRGWIRGCLQSSKASVLVNGSPTDEFSFHRGLRQGDPLSPFLFILVMESLHVSFKRLIDRGMFDPIFWGKENRVPISHLFYADDAMFIGKWSRSNVNVLMMTLHCFSLALGLKVNVHKSSIYGVGVHQANVQHMAENFGCISNNLPFNYLGVKVGANMMWLNSWSDVVKKVSNKLSSWKAKTLSVRGRLTLLKSVLRAILTYYMSLFKAPE
nr:RNA-directed DNA polymerase, eukaryota [Tanacetum cinerariifolium]